MTELIDKGKLLYYLEAIKPDEYVSAYGEAAVDVINHIETYVDAMPTIEPEVRHGRWIKQENGLNLCSVCGVTKVSHLPFCGHCGARMDATNTNVGGKGGDDSAGD